MENSINIEKITANGRACRECKYVCLDPDGTVFHTCTNPKESATYCFPARLFPAYKNNCGIEGQYFISKEEKNHEKASSSS